MVMRIGLGGILHETNTYSARVNQESEFEVYRGEEITAANRGARTESGGVFDAAAEIGAQVVPLLWAEAQPENMIERTLYEKFKEELLTRLEDAGPLDGVVLTLHGAGLVSGIGELEQDLCAAVRDVIGESTPLVTTLDMHGNNLTPEFVAAVDAALGCRFFPHTDFYERGQKALRLIPMILAGKIQPVIHVETVPILPPSTPTTEGCAAQLVDMCRAMEQKPGIIDCNVFHGFVHADWPTVGMHVVVHTDNDPALAASTAQELASWLWNNREAFHRHIPEASEAVASARSARDGLVILYEMADNVGGGAPGDGTRLLREMLDAQLTDACFGILVDPESVEVAFQAGVGNVVSLSLGGKNSPDDSPIQVEAYVKVITDGRFKLTTPMYAGRQVDLGPMARLVVQGIDVVVSTNREQLYDPAALLLHGIQIEQYRYLGVKSEGHFRAGFAGMWSEAIGVDGPGLSSADFRRFPRKISPALWPVTEVNYEPGSKIQDKAVPVPTAAAR